MPVVRIPPDTYSKLVEIQGELQSTLGKRISIGDVVSFIVNKSIQSIITEDDIRYLVKSKGTNKKKYVKAMLINYAILNHLSWNEANSILRDKCGSDVEHAIGSSLECIISFLEKEVFKKG